MASASEVRIITHLYRRPVETGYWVRVPFVTQDSEGIYYTGYGKSSYLDNENKPIRDEVLLPERLEKLAEPIQINLNSERGSFWMNSKGEVYFTPEGNPATDGNKRRVAKPNLEGITPIAKTFVVWAEGFNMNIITRIKEE